MKKAILTTKGGNTITTQFNAECSEQEVINFYNDNNFFSSLSEDYCEDEQVVNVVIVLTGLDTGFTGCSERQIEYDFKFNEYAQCYLCC